MLKPISILLVWLTLSEVGAAYEIYNPIPEDKKERDFPRKFEYYSEKEIFNILHRKLNLCIFITQ